MTALFPGASSFPGYWFVRELVAAGHEVVAACRGDGRYEGVRAERVRMVRELCEARRSAVWLRLWQWRLLRHLAFGNDDFCGTSPSAMT